MEVRAHLRYLRIAPRKVRLVVNLVRGLTVEQAVDQLSVLQKGSSLPVLKLLNSAVANAEHNFQLERSNLRIKSIVANEGPRLKRWQPRAFGRAAEILKKMTHITIILDEIVPSAPKGKKKVEKANTISIAAEKVAGAPATSGIEVPKKSKSVVAKKSSTAKSKARDAQDVTVRRQGKE